MNSTFFERVHGFLNRRSVSHSVECLRKSGVPPASSSSQFSMGVTSTAAVGPKLDPPLRFQAAEPPSSSTAAASRSGGATACARACPEQRSKDVMKTVFAAIIGYHCTIAGCCLKEKLAEFASGTTP